MQDNFCKLIELKNSKEWISFEKYYMNYNVFNQFDFFRLEDIHTNVLKSLLIQDNVYGLYTYPLEKLIELLIIKNNSKAQIKIEDLYKYKIENINIKTQVAIDRKNRLDLLIEFKINNKKYNIILENKMLSEEHDEQCKRYIEYFSNLEDDDTNYIFVYLSLEKEPKFNFVDKYICINYQELIDYVIEPCSYKCNDNNNNNVISLYYYLASFCKLFDYACLSNENRIIPTTKYGKELTCNLEEKYGELLINILEHDLQFYKLNKNVLIIYYYNLYKITNNKKTKLLIKKKLLNIKCTFNNLNCSYKECSLKIIQYLFNNKIINNTDDLSKLNNCLLNKSYVVATTNIENIKHANCYTTNDKSIGEIFLNNDKLYYYNSNVSGEELKYFVKNINNEFNNVLENIVEIN